MELTPTLDLAGLCLVIVIHSGVLALRLGISLAKA
ncbi:photosystem I reaction center subunit XII [Prochlorococcus sp. MIT 1307]|nr:photosystem I reaction center subunit XII [Prochlorococcus sp. MIT 1307]